MSQELPKYHETFTPILKFLNNKKTIPTKEIAKKVFDEYAENLDQEQLIATTKTGHNILNNRIYWGISYLKQGKFLEYPQRGHVQITEKGSEKIASGEMTMEMLKKDPEYIAINKAKKDKKSEEVDEISENASPQDLIDSGFSAIEAEVKNEILDRIKNMNPYEFEKVILRLLEAMGYGDFIETPKSGDGGVDGIMNQDKLGLDKIYMQAKRYADNKIRETDIRNFIGAMSGDTSKGIFVTTSSFDEKAEQKAKEAHHKIILIDGDRMADLMYEFKIGVQVKEAYEIRQIDNDFFDES